MNNKERSSNVYRSTDVIHVIKTVWSRAWLVVLCGLLAGVIGFSVSAFMIAPTYSSNVKLYVNNSSFSLGNANFSISSSELTAAQSLVKTYGDILDSWNTLERVIDKADVDYTWQELLEMIMYAPSNETEIMLVTVTCKDPYEASKIANAIASVLPTRISEIIDGATMEIVAPAIPNTEKVAPNITLYTAISLFIGALLAIMSLVVAALLDDTIHDEEYVLNTYDYPILGKVPDLLNTGNKSYAYYSQRAPRTNN